MKYAQLLTAIDSTAQHRLGRAAAAVNQALVIRNWLIGAYVVEFEQRGSDRARYGERLLACLSDDWLKRGIQGCSQDRLEWMRRFYLVYPHIRRTLVDQSLIPATLSRILPTPLVPRKSKAHLPVLEFTGLGERAQYPESDLETALLDHLQQFLLALGTGFCFEARQKRITVGTKPDYVDLVSYHRRLHCHVLIDLKTRAFTHGDAGQMNFSLNWWKTHGMERGDSPPVGIILCSEREKTEVEFATAGLDNTLFVSRYLVALPPVEQRRGEGLRLTPAQVGPHSGDETAKRTRPVRDAITTTK